MEVSLPISAALKPASLPSKVNARPHAHALSIALPARFIATGLTALAGGVAWLICQPSLLAAYHYSPATVSATHLFVLGWIMTIVMGAVYQLVPVALETRLYSERLARWQFFVHITGFAGMVWMFRKWNMPQVGHFGCILGLGFGMFAYNIARTLCRIQRWTVVAAAIASVLFWMSFTAVVGLSVAAGKCDYDTVDKFPVNTPVGALLHGLRAVGGFMAQFAPIGAMHAHAHLGIVGVFLMLIVGVSYKLVPMFALGEIQNARRAAWSIGLLNAGLAAAFFTTLTQSKWKPAAGLIMAVALVLYGLEMAAIIRARKRAELDWGIRYFLTAIALLIPVSLVGLDLSRPGLPGTHFNAQLENVYGYLALIGVVTFAIIGMLYKIAPFLVWFGVYSKEIGKARVPAISEMYCPKLQCAGFWLFIASLVLNCAGILRESETIVRAGCIFLALSFATVGLNMALILSHWLRPRLSPFPKTSTSIKSV